MSTSKQKRTSAQRRGLIYLAGSGLAIAAALALVLLGQRGDDRSKVEFEGGAGPLSGRIVAVAGNAGAKGLSWRASEDSDFTTLKSMKKALGAGSVLRTDAYTRAKLELSEGSTIVLNRDSELRFDSESARTLELSKGELIANVAELRRGARALFRTPHGDIEVLGTKFVLSTTQETSDVRVIRGSVRLKARKSAAKAEIQAGEEGVITANAKVQVAPVMQMASAVRWSELDPDPTEEASISGLGELRARKPGEREDKERPLELAHHKVTVRIVGNVARTEIEETFRNDSRSTLEGIYRFPLPSDASIAGLALEVNGTWEQGAFVERDRAKKIWRGVIRNATPKRQRVKEEFIWVPGPWKDPALLEWQRGGRFELRIYPIPARGERRIRIAYTQVLPPQTRGRRYVYPLAHATDASTRVGWFEAEVRLADPDGRTQVKTRGYKVKKNKEANAVRLNFAERNFLPAGDLIVDFQQAGGERELRYWTYQGEAALAPKANSREPNASVLSERKALYDDERPYALFALRPELPAFSKHVARDYALVVDSSQSMVGERFDRARRLVEGMVSEMDRRDRFHVLACDAACEPAQRGVQTPSTSAAARTGQWLRTVQPAGASDVVAGIAEAARVLKRDGDPQREAWIIYVGDGMATVGHRSAAAISAEVSELTDQQGVRLTTVGIGADADSIILESSARAGGGHYVPYTPGESSHIAALSVLETTYGVALRNAQIELPSGFNAIYPRKLPTLRAGQEVLVAARLDEDHQPQGKVTLRGTLGGKAWKKSYPVAITVSRAKGNAFVPRVWAQQQIAALELGGDGMDEARTIAVSKSYGVLSRKTSLLVLESEAMFRAFGVDRGQAAHQWTGNEEVEMSEGGSVVRGSGDADGSLQGLAATGKGYGGGGVGRADNRIGLGNYGSIGSGAAARESAPAAAPRGALRSRRGPAPSQKRRRAKSKAAEMAAPDDESEGSQAIARQEEPPLRRPAALPVRRPRGDWMRRVWFKEGSINSTTGARSSEERAVRVADRELRARPDSRDRHRDLVRTLSRAGELRRAKSVALKWLERDRLDPEALTYYSDVLGRQGRRDEAIRVLSGVVDLEPDNATLQRRLAKAFEREGNLARACAHRIALAEIERDKAATVADAIRCTEALGQKGGARRILASLPNEDVQTRAQTQASRAPRAERVRGELITHATWSGPSDLDLSLITPQGTRLSWMGGRTRVVGQDNGRQGRESLGLTRAGAGEYIIEVNRTSTEDVEPVRGEVRVEVLGKSQRLPFTLVGERVTVGRTRVSRRSRLERVR